MVTKLLRISLLVCTLALVSPAAHASDFPMDKSFGIGLEGGHGPGLSLKFNLAQSHSLQFGLSAFDYGLYRNYYAGHGHYYYGYEYGYGGFLIHGEYLKNNANLIHNANVALPWYFGGGLDLGAGSGSAAFAIHGNLGLSLQFRPVPLDIFLEWTPRVWIVDFLQFHPLDFNVGIRVWF